MSEIIRAQRGLLPASEAPRLPGPAPIAYTGGSVTVQNRGGYRSALHAALCTKLSRPHRAVLASIGGVGSISGLFLLDDLVLRHRPALCFVEFATTDMVPLTPPELLEDVLEELVTRLRSHECEPCFLLLGRLDSTEADRARVLGSYRRVAESRRVLMVDIAAEMAADPAMFRDVVHTTEAGADFVVERVVAALGDALPRPPADDEQTQTMLTGAGLAPADLRQLLRPEDGEERNLGGLFPFVRATRGNRFDVTAEGELAGLLVAVGPTSGWVRVSGGGTEPEEALLWDYWCHYERLSSLVLRTPRPSGSAVSIEAVERPIDYSDAHVRVENRETITQDLRLIGYMLSS